MRAAVWRNFKRILEIEFARRRGEHWGKFEIASQMNVDLVMREDGGMRDARGPREGRERAERGASASRDSRERR